jgi:hypothetical protein
MEIITGNALGDGRVVFQTASGWTHDINAAEVLEAKDALEAALARAIKDAAENRVVEPYAIDVTRGPAGILPARLREKIRADGPTTGNSRPGGAALSGKAA